MLQPFVYEIWVLRSRKVPCSQAILPICGCRFPDANGASLQWDWSHSRRPVPDPEAFESIAEVDYLRIDSHESRFGQKLSVFQGSILKQLPKSSTSPSPAENDSLRANIPAESAIAASTDASTNEIADSLNAKGSLRLHLRFLEPFNLLEGRHDDCGEYGLWVHHSSKG